MEKLIKKFLTVSYGYGDGSGDGYGSGSGYGDGDGSGDGSSSGSGIKSINNYTIYHVDKTESIFYSIKGNLAKAAILNKDLNLTDCFIVKYEDSFAHGETAKIAMADAKAKALSKTPIENRLANFKNTFKDYSKAQKASILFDWHNILTGSCEMGRKSFCKNKNIDIEKDKFSVNEFIELTKNEYEGHIIKLLI